ncbi:unnamed protein product [Urochloa humidicola]
MSEMTRVKQFFNEWADRGECSLKKGIRISPPRGIFDHLDLLGRGWGWEMLAPWYGGDLTPYKNYLKQYYLLNQPQSVAQALQDEKSRDSNVLTPLGSQQDAFAFGNGIGDWSAASYGTGNGIRDGGAASYGAGNGIGDGDGLVPFVSWCVGIEKQFIAEYERQGKEACGTAADIILSKEILERALSLINTGVEFPVAAAALLCITKITELMLEGLRKGIDTWSSVTNVRQCALKLNEVQGL